MTVPPPGGRPEVSGLVEDLFRRSAGEITAVLLRRMAGADLDVVEEAVQDAFVRALRVWPYRGIPRNPAGWLYRVATRHALDALTRGRRRDQILAEAWARGPRSPAAHPLHAPKDLPEPGVVADDELALLLLCCDEALPRTARVVTTLKVGCGFSVDEIAAAFLARPPAIAQRLVRAKRLLRARAVRPPEPTAELLAGRAPDLREVIYLVFAGGHAASAGDVLVREELCREAMRLGRLMLSHPGGDTPTTRALMALMALQACRLPARVDEAGALVPLEEQDRSAWDRALLAEGFHHLDRAAAGTELTRFHLEAGIAAVHAAATGAEATDWPRILEHYDSLLALRPSPVVALNRAVAVARVHGARAGLDAAAAPAAAPSLRRYHFRAAVLGALHEEAGDTDAAKSFFREAAALARSAPERAYLNGRLKRIRASVAVAPPRS